MDAQVHTVRLKEAIKTQVLPENPNYKRKKGGKRAKAETNRGETKGNHCSLVNYLKASDTVPQSSPTMIPSMAEVSGSTVAATKEDTNENSAASNHSHCHWINPYL